MAHQSEAELGSLSSNHAAQQRGRLLFVTPELADFLKVGGLGEVSASLPRALRQVTDVRVLLPGYRAVLAANPDMKIIAKLPAVADISAGELGEITTEDGLTIYVVISGSLFDRSGSAYSDDQARPWDDNDVRFARLAMAAVELARGLPGIGWQPDILHLNDWPGALTAGYLKWQGVSAPSILTIHNLAYQGNFSPDRLDRLAIPRSAFSVDGVEFHGYISFLKAGIYYASQITTVSAAYAQEITTPEFGCGLDGLLRARSREGRLSGILNGIDESWDPRTDPHLPHPFDASDWQGKEANARHIREEFGLAVSRGPLFAVVSRLVHQKGLDLTIGAVESIVRDGGQLVVTGEGEAEVEAALRATAARHPESIALKIGYEEAAARQFFAGSDFLLMPSRFEPCGLSQMYAQRFGSLPIAHSIGGLRETIVDGATGFLFSGARADTFEEAIQRAQHVFERKSDLNAMRKRAMNRPFGWQHAVRAYLEVYRRALKGTPAAAA
ncbi:MAG TPA: glycogen synthase GlgA [Candidatus Cybelea sp.]|nr:glycogen synthase GlgA [Candidatus Cybelea sp.]